MTKPIGKSIRFLVFSVINSRRNRPALWLLVAIGAIIFLGARNWKTDGDSIEHACTDAALFRWASSQGAELEKISIGEFLFEAEADSARNWQQRLRVRRGMRARKKILKGEVILSVPMNITFSAENALKTEIGDIVESLHLDQYVAMALMLLHERKKGAASAFFPYVCKIPATFETTLFWPLDQLDAATGGNYSNLYLQTLRMRSYLLKTYNRLMPLLFRRHPDRFAPATHGLRDFAWAMTAVFSRNWGVADRRRPAAHWAPPVRQHAPPSALFAEPFCPSQCLPHTETSKFIIIRSDGDQVPAPISGRIRTKSATFRARH